MDFDSPERKLKPCVMPTCKDKRFDLVHKFPMDNERAKQWLEIIDIPELTALPLVQLRKRCFICSKHFRKQDYKNCESRSLNKTAYPRLHLKVDCDSVEDIEGVEYIIADDVDSQMSVDTVVRGPEEENRTTIGTDSISIAKKSPQIRFILDPSPNNITNSPAHKAVDDKDKVVTKKFRLIEKPSVFQSRSTTVLLRKRTESSGVALKKVSNILSEDKTSDQWDDDTSSLNDNVNVYKKPKQQTNTEMKGDQTKLLVLQHPNLENPLKVCNFWLRDHCRCNECYATDTLQRKFNIFDIPLDVKPKEVISKENGHINIKWSDGHVSNYDIFDLDNQLNGKSNQLALKHKLWNKAQITEGNYASVTLNDYLCNDNVAGAIVESLIQFGCAFIKNVPANMQSTEIAIKRLFPIQRTLYGEMWSFTDNKAHSDSAYTNEELLAHNDNTYFSDAAGLQVLHCTTKAATGGESLLVDGFYVLKVFKEQHPEAYEYLTKKSIPAEYIEDGYHFKYCAPVIGIDPITNKPNQLRFNMNDRALFNNLPQEEMYEFYKNYRLLAREIQASENEWRFMLEPGTVCIFDNWRLLHGRNSYTGRRQIVGCYVSRGDYLSVARKMGYID